jgi:hypothetical protein
VYVVVATVTAQVDDQRRASGPAATANRGREVLAPPQPILGGQHGMIL